MAELKKVILEGLEQSGMLESIKNDLKNNLFNTLREETVLKPVSGRESGVEDTAADLVRDFFETFCMQYSLSVYIPEAKLPERPHQRAALESRLSVKAIEDLPVLSAVVGGFKGNQEGSELVGESINSSVSFSMNN